MLGIGRLDDAGGRALQHERVDPRRMPHRHVQRGATAERIAEPARRVLAGLVEGAGIIALVLCLLLPLIV